MKKIFSWPVLTTAAALFCCGALVASAQTDLSGYWAFRIKDGGVNYYHMEQNGDVFRTVPEAGGRGFRGGLVGTVKNGKVHLDTAAGAPRTPPPAVPGAAALPAPAGPPRMGMTRVYDGTVVNPNRIDVTQTTTGRDAGVWQGWFERVTKEEAVPTRIPSPELHNVPDNGLVRTPPMGWNSWNKYSDEISEKIIRDMADAMVSSGMAKAGYTYIVVDEGWTSGRDANGKIIPNGKFKDMKALADYVHSKGLKIGIYSSPGPQSCWGKMGGGGYEGSWKHEAEDAQTFADWGYDYLKYDQCSASGVYDNTTQDAQAAYQKMGEALLKTGRPMVYSLCQYGSHDVWKWGTNAGGNLWRTTGDINDSWGSMSRIGFAQVDISPYVKVGHWNDPDMLEVGNGGMTADEYRTHMSLWSMLAAPLMAGNDLTSMTDETKSILMNTDVIAVDQDRGEFHPVQRIFIQGTSEVLIRKLANNSYAVGLFNRGDASADISFRWDALKFDTGLGSRRLAATDLWKHAPVTVSGDTFTGTVPKHGVVMLRVSVANGGAGFGF
jgi:alpha-galactosidase